MILLIYIIKTILVSGILFSYYSLFLRNRKIHRFNRLFLVGIPVFSLIIPAFHFSLPAFWYQKDSGSTIRLLGVGQGKLEEAVTIYGPGVSRHLFSWPLFFTAITIGVSLFLLIRLLLTVRYLRRLPKNKPSMPLTGATVFFVSERGTPFSFFRSIFWGENQEINSLPARQILRHEIFHAANKHSADILWIEFLTVFSWFNPFLYGIHRELRAIHEYTADEYASAETDRFSYATLLLQNATGKKFPLTHPFFKTHIKRRIAMITQSKTRKSLLARFLIIPTIAALICLFSFKSEKRFTLTAPKTIRVIIDPGHGGTYIGANGNGINEKDFNLLLGKKIKSFSKEYNVEVILTRETDENIGDGSLRSSLVNRVELAEKQNADLFISIHANMQDVEKIQKENTGIMIYVPKKESKFYDASVRLGSIITESLKPDYITAPELKQRNTGVMVLDKSTVPAILIECGFLDNKADIKFMMDEKNQEKIARDILEGIRKYATDPITYQNNQKEPADTISIDALNNLDPYSIAELTIDKNYTVYVTLRNGKKLVNLNTPELQREWIRKKDMHDLHDREIRISDSAGPYKKVEVEAEFPGGQKGWYAYLQKNLKYPDSAVEKEVQGTVVIQFIVNKDGNLSDFKVLSGPELLRASTIQILKESGNWIPARQNGKVVASYHKLPLIYKLEAQ